MTITDKQMDACLDAFEDANERFFILSGSAHWPFLLVERPPLRKLLDADGAATAETSYRKWDFSTEELAREYKRRLTIEAIINAYHAEREKDKQS